MLFSWYVLVQRLPLEPAVAFASLAWITQLQWSIKALPSLFSLRAMLMPSLVRLTAAITPDDHPPSASTDGAVADLAGQTTTRDHIFGMGTRQTVRPPLTAPLLAAASINDADGLVGARLNPNAPIFVPAVRNPEQPERVVQLVGARLLTSPSADEAAAPIGGTFDVTVHSGELLVICGPVGAGKSTLLAALGGAVPIATGQIVHTTRRSYCAQPPFLMRDTIRSNVTFGAPYDVGRYDHAIKRAALGSDLAILPEGDETDVGEGGSNLSGGQRARVAFARALYAQADCAMLEDIFAAVDAATSALLWRTLCDLHEAGVTIVLSTNQAHLFSQPEVSRVLLIEDAALAAAGSYEDVRPHLERLGLTASASPTPKASPAATPPAPERRAASARASFPGDLTVYADAPTDDSSLSLSAAIALVRRTLRRSQGEVLTPALIDRACASLAADDGYALDTRKREGLISAADFGTYLREFGTPCLRAALLLTAVSSALLSVGANIFLSKWTDSAGSGFDVARRNLVIYVSLGCAGNLLSALETVLLTVCSLRASRRLHERLMARLLGAPLALFDATTTGALLNRFLSDVQVRVSPYLLPSMSYAHPLWRVIEALQNIDSSVPDSVLSLATQIINMATQLGLILVLAPWVALAMPLLLLVYSLIYARMRAAARDTRRIGAMSLSPVFEHYADALAGCETVAAFGAHEAFCTENARRVAELSRAAVMTEAVQKWAQALAVQMGCVLYFLSGVACVMLHSYGALTTSQFGLVLLYAGTLQRASMDLMMRLTAIEMEFVSVERIADFLRIETEGGELVEETGKQQHDAHVNDPWSGSTGAGVGALTLQSVVLRYHPSRPPALRGLSLSVKAGERMALCGRTGCGKSSFLKAVPRLYGLESGSIVLDGVDTASVRLSVRSHSDSNPPFSTGGGSHRPVYRAPCAADAAHRRASPRTRAHTTARLSPRQPHRVCH